MEWYRSGHNEHDWKSCVRQKRTEGSNPSHSAMKKDLRKQVLFQRYKSTSWICDMRFARDIHLRRVICLRAWVDLYHITFRVSEKYHVCRKANISQRAKRDISLKTSAGSNPSVKSANSSISYPLDKEKKSSPNLCVNCFRFNMQEAA